MMSLPRASADRANALWRNAGSGKCGQRRDTQRADQVSVRLGWKAHTRIIPLVRPQVDPALQLRSSGSWTSAYKHRALGAREQPRRGLPPPGRGRPPPRHQRTRRRRRDRRSRRRGRRTRGRPHLGLQSPVKERHNPGPTVGPRGGIAPRRTPQRGPGLHPLVIGRQRRPHHPVAGLGIF